MSKKNLLLLGLLFILIVFIVAEWKFFSVLLCLFLVVSILIGEIKGIEGNK